MTQDAPTARGLVAADDALTSTTTLEALAAGHTLRPYPLAQASAFVVAAARCGHRGCQARLLLERGGVLRGAMLTQSCPWGGPE